MKKSLAIVLALLTICVFPLSASATTATPAGPAPMLTRTGTASATAAATPAAMWTQTGTASVTTGGAAPETALVQEPAAAAQAALGTAGAAVTMGAAITADGTTDNPKSCAVSRRPSRQWSVTLTRC